MRVKPSALVAELSGSTAELTAASWKGRNYVRRKVKPANPNTSAQQAVRTAMANLVTLWRSLGTYEKAMLDTYGTQYRMSGFNVHTKLNAAAERAGTALRPVPPNPAIPAVADAAAATGATLDGDIDVTWTDPEIEGYTYFHILARKVGTNEYDTIVTVDALDESKTLSGLDEEATYDVYMFLSNPTTGDIGTSSASMAVAPKTT